MPTGKALIAYQAAHLLVWVLPKFKSLILIAAFGVLWHTVPVPEEVGVLENLWSHRLAVAAYVGAALGLGLLRYALNYYWVDVSDSAVSDAGVNNKAAILYRRVKEKEMRIGQAALRGWRLMDRDQRADAICDGIRTSLELLPFISEEHSKNLCPELWDDGLPADPSGLQQLLQGALKVSLAEETNRVLGECGRKGSLHNVRLCIEGNEPLELKKLRNLEIAEDQREYMAATVVLVRYAVLLRCIDYLLDAGLFHCGELAAAAKSGQDQLRGEKKRGGRGRDTQGAKAA